MRASRPHQQGRLTRWLDPVHRWTGAIIGALLALMGASGTLLIHEDAWLRATVPQAAAPFVDDAVAQGAALERLMSGPVRPVNVIFPSASMRAFTVSYGKGAGAYADQSGTIVERWDSEWARPELWLFDFHHHLWMGETGTAIVGTFALIGLGFVVTGLILWWRTRREFQLRALPASLSRLQIVRHHRDLGVIMTPLLITLFLTGSMLAFRPIADVLFAPLSARGSISKSLAQPRATGGPLAASFDWAGMLRSVRAAYPQAQIRGVGVPRRKGELIRVRVRQPDEWLPNGRTIFWFDPANGRLVESRDALSLPLATRAYSLVYPIHASKVGGLLYKVVMTVAGLALTLIGSLAVYSFWSYRSRMRARV